jgi:hypothetical protein
MDEEHELPSGFELFRLTVWGKDGMISAYEKYSASMESAIRDHKDMSKLVKIENIDPWSKAILD